MDADEHPKPDAEDMEGIKKKPKLNEEEEAKAEYMAIDPGTSSADITQIQKMDVESSVTYDIDEFWKQEAIRRLQLKKSLYTMDFIQSDSSVDEVIKKLKDHKLASTLPVTVVTPVRGRLSKLRCLSSYEAYYSFLEKLVSFSPYIQWDDECDEKLEWLREKGHLPSLCGDIFELEIFSGLEAFCGILTFMERRFHPLIREGHKNELLAIIKRRCLGVRRTVEQGFENHGGLLAGYRNFILKYIEECKQSSKRYQDAVKQLDLHRQFDLYLDSCDLIRHDSSIDQLIKDERVVTKEFSSLNLELIEESLKAIVNMLKKINEHDSYSSCLLNFVDQRRQKGKSELDELLCQLKEEGFFEFSHLPSDNAAQENRECSKLRVLLDKAKNVAFPNLPDHYVVQGLLDYSFIFSLNGESHVRDSVEDRLGYVQECCEYKDSFLRQELWLNRSYDSTTYEEFGEALSLIDLKSIDELSADLREFVC